MARMGRNGFNKKETAETNAGEVGTVGRAVVLREAFREQSLFGGQEMQQCACSAIAKQCTSKRCRCRKAWVLCMYVPVAANAASVHEEIKRKYIGNCILFIKRGHGNENLRHDFILEGPS